jgi:hypothetical protein
MISSEINFAVGVKETALKIEKLNHPETPSYYFTSTFYSRFFSGAEMGRVSIQPTYYPNFCPLHPLAMKKITPFALLQILFLVELLPFEAYRFVLFNDVVTCSVYVVSASDG